ncbi:MAG: hypothetical protein UX99_C0017G0019 [Candidatus Amesbacteria bacterium GW2011_GWB1_47_26]|uniref:TrbL/VirB6 plasmid conjugal transfer protein n=1 Tax=Candidatus Amesbacteria bacterium GW2011_GWC2_45_19 TaxID=1618366 RepID=A0A0G1Q207_9BACT|nr:MAG: hypothetical protein UX05_C0009G0021 [Candidatus Amesbacteria bacterium GW2011_GWC2_45_19]KKU37820.1 MAG: hypothetical protein UX52_C0017G0007 [Candidatus Amesbacteria bacterium GW2011_GWA1_46_35]KKU69360.1 MAG: hypothetical protein UX93_C0002G0199 [Microgenomates group bacterium GW2011_GWC1_47_20]KKU74338.1 MAG: hypothetical protein UX99_C0017G0019 [Candidatus Amesbacteria bacterium GW2011_GWB1_47_26]KKU79081.1 MAG: hypothetical protein UY06_C0031G0002 [Candidatus Amesbacteria bacteriu
MKKFLPVLLTLFYSSTLLLSSFASPIPASAQAPTTCVITDLINLIPWIGNKISQLVLPDGPWYNQNTCQFNRKVFDTTNPDEIFGERYTFAQINWIINSLQAVLNPFVALSQNLNNFIDAIKNLYASNSPPPTFAQYSQLGVAGILVGTISDLYASPPASGIQSINNALAYFDITTTAHAQGYGYGALNGFKKIWSASRNMTYLIMTVLLVVAGFMVMFRVKINPQTAVTLQLMIPKIIITLLLVTFSYAIAGLVIDMVYVLISFVIVLLGIVGSPPVLTDVGKSIAFLTSSDYGKIFWYFMAPWLVIFAAGGLTILIAAALAPPLAPFVLPALGAVGILNLIVGAFFFILLFKVWWMLLKTYLTLMLLIVVGPWQIMLGLLPGQSGFGSWLRNIIAQASTFVVVPLMFLFTMLIWNIPVINPLGGVNTGTGLFMTLPNFPFQDGNGIIFNFAVGYAILALTPKIAEIIRDALKVPAFKYGTAFGEALGPIRTMGGWGQAGASVATDRYTAGLGKADPWERKAIDIARYLGALKGKPGS